MILTPIVNIAPTLATALYLEVRSRLADRLCSACEVHVDDVSTDSKTSPTEAVIEMKSDSMTKARTGERGCCLLQLNSITWCSPIKSIVF